MNQETKRCIKCEIWKPCSCFYKQFNSCIQCISMGRKEYYRANRLKIIAKVKEYDARTQRSK